MIIEIPTDPTLYSYKEEIVIDDVSYVITLSWNSRFNFWIISFALTDGTELISGMKVVYGIDLFAQYPANGLPNGSLYLLSNDSSNKPAFGELGDTVSLIYVPEGESATI